MKDEPVEDGDQDEPADEIRSDDAAGLREQEDGDRPSFLRRPSPERPRALWLISYADFMTVLMIFFLAMYGYTYLAKDSSPGGKSVSNYQDFMSMVRRMQAQLGDQMKVEETAEKVTLQVGEKVLFPSGSARLSVAAATTLADLANSVKLLEGDVIIEGHTDNVPVVGGPFKSNWELSAARAFSVINALSENGVDPKRLAAWGFGENRPVAANDSAENRARNRRIEVIVMRRRAAV